MILHPADNLSTVPPPQYTEPIADQSPEARYDSVIRGNSTAYRDLACLKQEEFEARITG